MKAWRIILAAAGILLVVFGAARLLTEIPVRNLLFLGAWLVAALAIHDGLLSPAVVSVGWLLRRFVPHRGRRHLQIALIMVGVVTVIALPMIYLQGSQPVVKALLLRDYTANLGLLIFLIGMVTLGLYAVRVARDMSASAARRARSDPPQT